MTDYSTWKVTELKAELKRRGIAQTGLRVKQQFIDRLVEEDAKGAESPVAKEDTTATQNAVEESQPAEEKQPTPPAVDAAESHSPKPEEQVQEQQQDKEVSGTDIGETQAEQKTTDVTQDADAPTEKEREPPSKSEPAELAEAKPETGTLTQPVEQAPGNVEEKEPTLTKEESTGQTESAEKVAPAAAPPSELATGVSTPLPAEELIEDFRKRKRRSQSPVPTPEAQANKKAKLPAEAPRVLLSEDSGAMDIDGVTKPDETVPVLQEPSEEHVNVNQPDEQATVPHDDSHPPSSSDNSRSKKSTAPKQDVRFKGLFVAGETEQTRPASPPADTISEDAEVEPALHVATAALYVGGLMRPLQPAALKSHLINIASPPGASPDPDVVVDFYLDSIKTHCFVNFTSVTAASRARAALHNTVWPNERNRKTLFVDFIPEQKLHQWIDTEENSRGRSGPPARWEVKYDRTDDGVEAVLEEIDPKNAGPRPARGPAPSDFSRPPPLGPRADMEKKDRRPSGPSQAEPSSRPGQGFKPLDELFMSTTTKPKLYYLPVPRDVADRRLDRFDDLLRKGSYPRPGGDETRRISFEDGDLFVDNGPEFGGRNRRRGGRGRGRGGFGDSWRGDRKGRP
ncbi:SAP domain protein [Aspergillus nomiae NRRL 13137]|uniref:SAP domain protein n=1 Tax=Aspergillus nomiae NRRL (strain ATCC 15546 / NRRL 13137 / CBS 260.88 / M93) TaxID=1509407 RepID=A0A0L1ITL3_ASPN3|nr:SAP domain protein [Aspergillus nomiae NRRL 13137]KNG82829.1 SAP domain protein [Aspergillus nomiae NRRL 13137]